MLSEIHGVGLQFSTTSICWAFRKSIECQALCYLGTFIELVRTARTVKVIEVELKKVSKTFCLSPDTVGNRSADCDVEDIVADSCVNDRYEIGH